MSFDIPATIQQDIQQYAKAEQITPEEAILKVIQAGLKTIRSKSVKNGITEDEWRKLRAIPIVLFFEKLPESGITSIEAANRKTRAERLPRRA